MRAFTKMPAEILDYTVDWSGWLAEGDSITAVSWVVPNGVSLVAQANDGASATIWLSGGAPGVEYWVTNRVTTAVGRTAERSFRIVVVERKGR